MAKIVLASASPRRKQLLEWAEISFQVMATHADESFPPGLPIGEVPVYIARNKAIAALQETEDGDIIIAADTVVVIHNKIIGKPKDRAEALSILSLLSGETHQVITGVVIVNAAKEIAFADTTTVTFHQLNEQQISFYVDKYQPYDKAGAYAIQEWIGVIGIASVSGDFYNVMGLPVSRVVKALNELQGVK